MSVGQWKLGPGAPEERLEEKNNLQVCKWHFKPVKLGGISQENLV